MHKDTRVSYRLRQLNKTTVYLLFRLYCRDVLIKLNLNYFVYVYQLKTVTDIQSAVLYLKEI